MVFKFLLMEISTEGIIRMGNLMEEVNITGATELIIKVFSITVLGKVKELG